MKRLGISVACATGAAAIATLCIGLSAHAGSGDIPNGDVASILETEAASGDALPTFLQEGPQAHTDLDTKSSRSLGSLDGSEYWIAESKTGDLCLVVLVSGPDQLASSTCAPAKISTDTGLTLQVQSAAAGTTQRLYYIPDGYEASFSDAIVRVSDNLLVGVTKGTDSIELPVATPSGATKGSAVDFRTYSIEPLPEEE